MSFFNVLNYFIQSLHPVVLCIIYYNKCYYYYFFKFFINQFYFVKLQLHLVHYQKISFFQFIFVTDG